MIEHTSKQMVIQLEFAKKENISTGSNKDMMVLEILHPEILRSSSPPFLGLNLKEIIEADGDEIVKPIPPQIAEETKNAI